MSEQPVYIAEWSLWTKRVAVIVLMIAGVYALTFLAPVLQILVIALLLVLFFFPPVQFFRRRFRLPYALAVTLVFVIYFFVIIYTLLRLGPAIAETVSSWQQPIESALETALSFLRDYEPARDGILVLGDPPLGTSIDINFILEPLSGLVKGSGRIDAEVGNIVSSIAGGLANIAGQIIGTLGTLILGHLIAFMIFLEMPSLYRWFVRLDDAWEREYAILFRDVYRTWYAFFRGQVIIALLIGIVTWLQFILMGIQGAVLVGFVVGVLALIPTVGSLLGIFPVALATAISGSSIILGVDRLGLVFLAVIINMLITQTFMLNVVAPKITGDAVQLPLPVIIIGLFIGTAFGGIVGALLIAPILGTLRIIAIYMLRKIRGGDPFPGEERPVLLLDNVFGQPIPRVRRGAKKPA